MEEDLCEIAKQAFSAHYLKLDALIKRFTVMTERNERVVNMMLRFGPSAIKAEAEISLLTPIYRSLNGCDDVRVRLRTEILHLEDEILTSHAYRPSGPCLLHAAIRQYDFEAKQNFRAFLQEVLHDLDEMALERDRLEISNEGTGRYSIDPITHGKLARYVADPDTDTGFKRPTTKPRVRGYTPPFGSEDIMSLEELP